MTVQLFWILFRLLKTNEDSRIMSQLSSTIGTAAIEGLLCGNRIECLQQTQGISNKNNCQTDKHTGNVTDKQRDRQLDKTNGQEVCEGRHFYWFARKYCNIKNKDVDLGDYCKYPNAASLIPLRPGVLLSVDLYGM